MNTTNCFPSLPLKFRYTSGEHDPLHTFYIPVLQRAQRYDRAAGYFSSNAFVVAAQGVAHLIAHGGAMRLLVGAQLSPEDAEAIRRGEEERERVLTAALARLLPDPEALADRIARARLEALAWLVAEGRLQIRVVLPEQPTPDRPYFHVKYGVLTDACGHRVAFHGSVNETATGWRTNFEDFSVFRSWLPGEGERVEDFAREFERIWQNQHPGWRAYPIPEAAHRRLLTYRPPEPPLRDPLERSLHPKGTGELPGAYLVPGPWLARFLRDAPFFPNAEILAQATAAVAPWPHQAFVLRHILTHFPQRFLISDEVGLGKTIEAGLVLRQLRLMGLAQRTLILAPKSILRQWQEELYEKFNLSVPIYDGKAYRLLRGENIPAPEGPAAWENHPWLLASAQLARRADRRKALLQARRWDVVVVDEAHHARRRDFMDLSRYRPNQLLSLLQQLSLHTEFLLLLTATPMQVHPIEVWDLLALLGLSGRWAVGRGREFLAFFEALEKPSPVWGDILPLVHDEIMATEGNPELRLPGLSAPQRQRLRGLLTASNPEEVWRRLPEKQRQFLEPHLLSLARRHTPLRRLVLRHTRALLRDYHERGLLSATVPTRDPRPQWIPMSTEETMLYRAVSNYIATFYHRYEESRRGLGFVLTVYRRRLTSSLYALRTSLERRLKALRRAGTWLEADDEASAERLLLEEDQRTDIPAVNALPEHLRLEEISALETLLDRMSTLGDHDSKSAQLLRDLPDLLKARDKVIVFTQYTDTMNYLRERLKTAYGKALACYSGQGGERWDGNRWKPVSKEAVKNAFAKGEVRVLLATDAASEGLNLQTCGVLINYDMPWNPMRVEQRIGRIDRIGQTYETVWIYHYFYEGTIEEKVYRRLGERIGFFRQVIGPLQPILARVEDLLETLSVLPPEEQESRLEDALRRLEAEATTSSFDLDQWSGHGEPNTAQQEAPWTPQTLEAWVRTTPSLQEGLQPAHAEKGVYWFEHTNGKRSRVTFSPQVFEAHPESTFLLTYGGPLWEEWLQRLETAQIGRKASSDEERILMLSEPGPPATIAWYIRSPKGIQRIETLNQLRTALEKWNNLLPWDEASRREAQGDFARIVKERIHRLRHNKEVNARLQYSALQAQGLALLRRATALALAIAEREPLFTQKNLRREQAWSLLKKWGAPFTHALEMFSPSALAEIDEEAYQHFRRQKRQEHLTQARTRLGRELSRWLGDWQTFLEERALLEEHAP